MTPPTPPKVEKKASERRELSAPVEVRTPTVESKRAYAAKHGLIWHGFMPGDNSTKPACGVSGVTVPDMALVTCEVCAGKIARWFSVYGPMPVAVDDND